MTWDDDLKALGRALRTLEGTEGRPIARRNARKRVLAALSTVRRHLDTKFPALRSGRKGVRRLTLDGRLARLKRKGYQQVTSQSELVAFAAAGIRPVVISRIDAPWFPGWAVAIGPDLAALAKAKRSARVRREILAVKALSR